MKKLLLLLVILSFQSFAQNSIISGKVADKHTQVPLIGANVLIVGTTWGSATDVNGIFTIKNIPAGTYTIRVSFVGYDSEIINNVSVSKNDSLFFTINLETDFSLNEIVVEDKREFIEHSTSTLKVLTSDQLSGLTTSRIRNYGSLQSGIVAGYKNDIRYPSDAFNTEEYGLIVENDFLD
ncbi:MAG TPA: carboxypeptidase-like regulatory domain-containing protein, partial [Ignavibacteriaceae bacterium]|nr:carboxypeptidase-like regulatory domain-containing protein [Ignavibacteriaceae bacterium]